MDFTYTAYGHSDVQLTLISCCYSSLYITVIGHEIQEVSNERGVYKYMMEGYRSSVRPVRNDSESVDLKIDLHLSMLEDLVQATVTVLPQSYHLCFYC